MIAPLLSQRTEQDLTQFVAKPAHAVLLIAPNGAGKGAAAYYLASQLLGVQTTKLQANAAFKEIEPAGGKAISIEEIRAVTHFLVLKSTSKAAVTRVVLIQHAGSMTLQAQNALLKTIEEPPIGTVLILTAANELDLLPTILSRVQIVNLQSPPPAALKQHFVNSGYSAAAIDRAVLMSDGLPGLTQALLAHDDDHPLVAAAAKARKLLQESSFERLAAIDELTKDKQQWLDVLFIVQRMAQINLEKPGAAQATARKWHGVLRAAHEAYAATLASAQIKLVALNFMLQI
jgi:DNA polymerase-3 subunit delta'